MSEKKKAWKTAPITFSPAVSSRSSPASPLELLGGNVGGVDGGGGGNARCHRAMLSCASPPKSSASITRPRAPGGVRVLFLFNEAG